MQVYVCISIDILRLKKIAIIITLTHKIFIVSFVVVSIKRVESSLYVVERAITDALTKADFEKPRIVNRPRFGSVECR